MRARFHDQSVLARRGGAHEARRAQSRGRGQRCRAARESARGQARQQELLQRIRVAAAETGGAGRRSLGATRHSRRRAGQPLLSRAARACRSAARRSDRNGDRGRYRTTSGRARGGAAMNEWSQALSAHPAAGGAASERTISGNRGLQIEEPLIFEQDSPGHCGVDLPEPPKLKLRLGALERKGRIGLPGLSEPQIVRHFTRLSQKNYAIDTGLYPLGSCTMKHNPRLNEKMARLAGFADIHPLQPISTVQGALELIDTLAHWLKTLTGLPAVALPPAAGAHGELCGLMAIKAALEAKGERRQRVLVPESAHGTNPATAASCGFEVESIPATADGR